MRNILKKDDIKQKDSFAQNLKMVRKNMCHVLLAKAVWPHTNTYPGKRPVLKHTHTGRH